MNNRGLTPVIQAVDGCHHQADQDGHRERHRREAGQAARAAQPGDREAHEAERERRQREQAGEQRERLAALRSEAGRGRAGGHERPEHSGSDADRARARWPRGRYRVPQA